MTMLAAPYPTRLEAVQAAKADPTLCAITLDGLNLVLDAASAHDLEVEGVAFAYLCWCRSIGRVVTLPVNER